MTTIYYPYAPDKRPWERRPSLEAVNELERAGYSIVRWPCHAPEDDAEGLAQLWQSDETILIVEHDMAPTVEQIADLVACPEVACTAVYWLMVGTTDRRPMLSAFLDGVRIRLTQPYATYIGIGCCKLTANGRRRETPFPRVRWGDIEYHVNARGPGSWHVHWDRGLVRHYHGMRVEVIPDV